MRTRGCVMCLTLMLLAAQTNGQIPPTASQSGTVEAALRKTVAFVRVECLKGAEPWEVRGTGFFVAVEDRRLRENRVFIYLVTNRHVASPEEKGGRFRVLRTWLRLNLKEPVNGQESSELLLPLSANQHWFFPADDAIDLAVLPIVLDVQKYDLKAVPFPMFATQDVIQSQHIEEGDRILFAGFFYQLPGLKKVRPIVREGILAMMSDEKMETTLHKPGRVYLADVHTFGGNSGAPVFVGMSGIKEGAIRLADPDRFPFRFLGVVSGYYYEDIHFKLTVATTLEGKTHANSGISIVVPADQLKALLESPELKRIRDSEVARQQGGRHGRSE